MTLHLRKVGFGSGRGAALSPTTLAMETGDWILVLGPNGGGKSTLAGLISGRLRPSTGQVVFDDADISGWDVPRRVDAGIVEVTEGRNLFISMSVEENLRVARRSGNWSLPEVYTLFPQLANRANILVDSLSGGERQMLAVARALVCQPRLLVLDEPTTGLAPMLRRRVHDVLRRIVRDGAAVLQFEQLLPAEEAPDRRVGVLVGGRLRVLDGGEGLSRTALFDMYVKGVEQGAP